MLRARRIIILVLFTLAALVIVFVGSQWISEYFQTPLEKKATSSTLKLLVSFASFALLALVSLRLALERLIRWAAATRKIRLLRVFQKLAPAITKRVLGSLVGTSIVLSAAAVANANAPVTTTAIETLGEQPTEELAGYKTSSSSTVPNAQWFSEPVNIPMNSLISPGADERRNQPTGSTEIVVSQGENLWSIAVALLGTQATTEEIAAYWPKIYDHNKEAIGPNPDILQIGTVLEKPPTE